MTLEWTALRPYNGSQQNAFEELVCQLARYEEVPLNSEYFRKGTPDAGLECYWETPEGIWGWQAKFFLQAPGTVQWRQIDDSIKTAIEKHPNITRIEIALPIDRADPRLEDHMHFMDRWNEHKKKWNEWSQEKNMDIKFKYWGKSEIFNRLADQKHAGRSKWWFDQELMSDEWFNSHFRITRVNIGERYFPEVNITLPISEVFDGLGRTRSFFKRIYVFKKRFLEIYRRVERLNKQELTLDLFNNVMTSINYLIKKIEVFLSKQNQVSINMDTINIEELLDKYNQCINFIDVLIEKLSSLEKNGKPDEIRYTKSDLYSIQGNLREFADFIVSPEVGVSNTPALLISGQAGTGKTHLFCDVTKKRLEKGFPTILLLGSHFQNVEPWSQILRELDLNLSRREFLNILETIAQLKGKRVLLLIDALNEGEGKQLWNHYLSGIIEILSNYNWIGLAVSVRSSYIDYIVPSDLIQEKLIQVDHFGFQRLKIKAIRKYFDYFNIQHPSIPLLNHEFQNPLFLRLFCTALSNSSISVIPSNLRGITSIFDYYLEAINQKLSRPENLDFDRNSQTVKLAVEKLIEEMVSNLTKWLPREKAIEIINSVLPRQEYSNSLFYHLLSEGVIKEDRFWVDGRRVDGIDFTFERFTDHSISRILLDKYFIENQVDKTFNIDQSLLNIFEKSWEYSGLIHSMSIIVPERTGKELLEIAPTYSKNQVFIEAFINSIIWRNTDAFSQSTKEIMNKIVTKSKTYFDHLLDNFLLVSWNPDHPYNAEFLHNFLKKHPLAIRDSWWTTFLYYHFEDGSTIDRIIEWAYFEDFKNNIYDLESLQLIGISLMWFLSSSNRFLRDRATKALVNLLTNHISILNEILNMFHDINDLYIVERLYAVIYGCVLRNKSDLDALKDIATNVYKRIFDSGEPISHILIRDYSKCIIETVLHCGIQIDYIQSLIEPPYRNPDPFTIPTDEEIGEIDIHQRIYGSVMGMGDFARYIIGTNHPGFFHWLNTPINESPAEDVKFDLNDAQKWILKRVSDLGWKSELFENFDDMINRMDRGRSSRKIERIGKKYQWIAFYQCLAHIADRYVFRGEEWPEPYGKYEGSWQIDTCRNIDPSCLVRKSLSVEWYYPSINSWWFSVQNEKIKDSNEDRVWLNDKSNLPDVSNLINITNSNDKSQWVNLKTYVRWESKFDSEISEDSYPKRIMNYKIWSFLVKKDNIDNIFDVMKEKFFQDSNISENTHGLQEVFLGEYFWAPAFQHHNIPYYNHPGWEELASNIPYQGLLTTEKYVRELGYDCSLDKYLSFFLPCEWLVNNLELEWAGNKADFTNKNNELIAFDPSLHQEGPNALLMNRNLLIEFLSDSEFDIIWVVLGEKHITDGKEILDTILISGLFRQERGRFIGNLNTLLLK